MGISLANVAKTFPGGVVGIEQVDLEIGDGELVALVGASGSGKTTTLRVIAGLEQPTRGRVTLGGRDVTNWAPHKRRIAFVGQQPVLHPRWTVSKHLAFAWALRHGPAWGSAAWWTQLVRGVRAEPQFRRQQAEVAETWQIDDLLDRPASDLSGGQQQRVALARATIGNPTAYLLDEPFSALDVRRRVALRWRLKSWQQRCGKPMLYVTHDQAEALALGQRIAVLHAGRLQQFGTAREVYDRPTQVTVAQTVGPAPMNLAAGHLVRQENLLQLRNASGQTILWVNAEPVVASPTTGCDVTVGVRPEHIRLQPDSATAACASPCGAVGRIAGVEPQGNCLWIRVMLCDGQHAHDSELSDGAGSTPPVELPLWLAIAPSDSGWQAGDRVRLEWPPQNWHAFDTATGRRWEPGSGSTS